MFGSGSCQDRMVSMESIDALLEQRITMMERLAECANEIKRIDEQLKSTDTSLCRKSK
jgi:hypothetical protein